MHSCGPGTQLLMGVDEPKRPGYRDFVKECPTRVFTNANDLGKVYIQDFDQPKSFMTALILREKVDY